IGQARARGKSPLALSDALVRDFLARDLLPEDLAALPIQAEYGELLNLGRLRSAAHASAAPPAAAHPTRTAPAKLRPGQKRIKTIAQFVFRNGAAFLRIPFIEPLRNGVGKLVTRERAIFIAIGQTK